MPSNDQGHPRKWLILAVVTMVAFISNVDATIVVVALPRIVSGLHTTVTTGLWTLNAYIITSTVLLLPAGRWSDQIGRKRVFVAGAILFALGTVLCGLAPDGGALIGWRLLQGAGGALGFATAVPILADAFPARQLGQALGINSTAWVMGAIVGPVVGGVLVSTLGWRWIFFVSVPFAVAAVVFGARILPAAKRRAVNVRNDWPGAVGFSAGLVTLLLALSQGLAWGWTSAAVLLLLVATLVLLASFTFWESRADHPMFELDLFRRPHFRSGIGVVTAYSIALFATTFLLTFYLQGAMGLSPLDAGLILVPLAAPQLLAAPLGGSLADRLGPARPILAGLALLVVGAVWLSHLGARFSPASVVLPLLLMSLGNGLAWPSLVKAVMSSAPTSRAGVASGMFFTLRNGGMALSFTLALVVAESSLPPPVAVRVFLGVSSLHGPLSAALVHATDAGFWVFAVFYAAALVLAAPLLRRQRRQETVRAAPVAD